MARTFKEGKRWRGVKIRPESPEILGAIGSTGWGHTEKIRRRHRSLWSRLLGKRRRALDKKAVAAS